MSEKMLLICDRCKQEGFKEDDFKTLKVKVGINPNYYYTSATFYPSYSEWGQDWCEKCCTELHILSRAYKPEDRKPEEPKLPTLEDMVREICKEEIENSTGA